jgi:hypothetical protein
MPNDTTPKDAAASAALKTPKAAAFAGIVFSVLLIAFFGLLRISIPADPLEAGVWLTTSQRTVAIALNLVPFAGVAFLWFIGVLRDRLDRMEDRFFATIYFGSSLLFLAMLFTAAAVIGALVLVATSMPQGEIIHSTTFYFSRATAYIIMNVYAIKMAGMFMIATSTVTLRTGIAPSWIAYLGFVLALILLLGSYYITWSFMVLPIWVLLLSGHILIDNFYDARASRRRT